MENSVTIILDKERELRLDFTAFKLFEGVTGRSALSESTWSFARSTDISALIWAAQVAHARAPFLLAGEMVPEDLDVLKLDQVRAWLTADRIEEAQKVLDRVWGLFSPESPKSPESSGEGGSGGDPPRS